MNQMNRKRIAPAVVGCCTLLLWDEAFAYIDPGTGSLLIQWLFGAAIAGFAVVNVYWDRAKGFFSRKAESTGSAQDTDRPADEAGSD